MITGRVLGACLLWCCVGCAATTVRSGRPPEDVPAGYYERWHSEFFWGLVPASAPYDLARICPAGWSQVTVARDPFTLVAGLVSLFIYAPARVTIVCAVPGTPHLPPAEGYAPNAPNMPSPPRSQ
ncbi:MAG: hypothetical protein ABI627_26375 [Polyangiaceae bacterium]